MPERTTDQSSLSTTTTQPQTTLRLSWPVMLCFDLAATCFWIYALTKLFVFDFDTYFFASYLPDYSWVLNYKLLFVLVCAAIALIMLGHFLFWSGLLYTLVYPLVVLLWKLPRLFYKQRSWTAALAFAEFIISFFLSFRRNLIAFTLFLSSFVAAFISSDAIILWTASSILFILLFHAYIRSFISVFRPTGLFKLYRTLFTQWRSNVETTSGRLDDVIRNVPVASMTAEQQTKWQTSLEATLLFNRVALFVGRQLRLHQKSNVNTISAVISTLGLILFTTISFAAINLALYKANPSIFTVVGDPSFFMFTYYSFKTLFFGSINEIAPSAPLSQITSMIESFCSVVLGMILVTLLISIRTKRYSSDLDETISNIEGAGKGIEVFIRDEFKIETIEQALTEVERAKGGLAAVLMYLTRNMN